jgi:hypothetical protein
MNKTPKIDKVDHAADGPLTESRPVAVPPVPESATPAPVPAGEHAAVDDEVDNTHSFDVEPLPDDSDKDDPRLQEYGLWRSAALTVSSSCVLAKGGAVQLTRTWSVWGVRVGGLAVDHEYENPRNIGVFNVGGVGTRAEEKSELAIP